VVVHLYGQPVDMHGIRAIAEHYGLPVIEDASQAHGATYGGQRVGGLGAAAAFSFYPTKNLGAFGDGGAVVSSDPSLIERVAGLRNYGSRTKYEHTVRGHNSRLDPLQAAFLRVKLGWLDRWNTRRREVAAAYTAGLEGCAAYRLPVVTNDVAHVWHQYVVRHSHRDSLREALAERGIGTALHYPIPPHRTPAYAGLGITEQMLPVTERLSGTVLSLPMGPYLTDDEVARVIDAARDCG
jgi:dTDP-4-amino-4,6-dideoxygalactose transaminase